MFNLVPDAHSADSLWPGGQVSRMSGTSSKTHLSTILRILGGHVGSWRTFCQEPHQRHPYPSSPGWIFGWHVVLDVHSGDKLCHSGAMFQISSLYDDRNPIKDTPIHHLQVGSLGDRWFLTHILDIQGVPKKISLKLIFEYLSLGWVFLGVIFHEKTFLFYEIFLMSKQKFEKMATISWNIVTNIVSL